MFCVNFKNLIYIVEIIMVEIVVIKWGGKYCVVGSCDNVSCINMSYFMGIFMYRFFFDKVLC